MFLRHAHVHAAVAAAAILALPVALLAAEPTTAELKARIDALHQEVESLKARQVSATDVDATVRQILADADRRSQFLAVEGFTAGYDKGKFVLRSSDGAFSFSPSAQLQVRYVGNYREDTTTGKENTYEDGFEIRRAKFGFAGNVVSPDLTYKFQWATNRNAGGTNASIYLEDAWARYKLSPNWSIFAGQFEDPISHEAVVSSARQLAAESSLIDSLLISGVSDYVQGAGVAYETGKLRLQGIFHDGAGSQNTNFQDASGSYWGTTGRAEFLALGDNWKQYDDFTALNNKSDLLVFGAGADYSQGADRDLLLYGLDAQWEPIALPGLSVYTALVGQFRDAQNGAANLSNHGYLAQAGYAFNSHWELFGRYDQTVLDPDGIPADAEKKIPEITLGVNYYINGHAAKFTADVVYLPSGFDNRLGLNATGAGVLPTNGDANEVVARVQFQLTL